MAYKTNDYSKLLGIEGFSNTLLNNHFTLYGGYVTNTNKIIDTMIQMTKDGKAALPEYAEIKRRFGWEFDGMRLHELYFENLGGKGAINSAGALAKAMVQQYGSYDAWEKEFKATGTMRGIGWVVLYQDTVSGMFCNAWITEHDGGHLAGCIPLLIMDVFEHAYMVDYGLKKADYITAFFKNINWPTVEKRMK